MKETRTMLEQFRDFIARGDVMDLPVGIMVLGAAARLVREHGRWELISLSPVPLARTLRQLGFRRAGSASRTAKQRDGGTPCSGCRL
jgi:hypothetical protein